MEGAVTRPGRMFGNVKYKIIAVLRLPNLPRALLGSETAPCPFPNTAQKRKAIEL